MANRSASFRYVASVASQAQTTRQERSFERRLAMARLDQERASSASETVKRNSRQGNL